MDGVANNRRGARLWLAAYGAGFLACAALAWAVRDAPVQPGALGGLVRVDALGAFFGLLAIAGGALLTARGAPPLRAGLATLALVAGYSVTHLLALAAVMLVATLLLSPPASERPRPLAVRCAATNALAPACLLLAVVALWLRGGAWRYDAPAAGAVFSSFVFWFMLLAALAGGFTRLRRLCPLFPLWLYPLLRLYSLGPWNTGWSFATLLGGGAAALWCAAEATRAGEPERRAQWVVGAYGGVALAGAGLSSAAGVAACCYASLCALLLMLGLPYEAGSGERASRERGAGSGERASGERGAGSGERRAESGERASGERRAASGELGASGEWGAESGERRASERGARSEERVEVREAPALWPALLLATLSGALPITAPFVALWLGVGAAVAGGVPLLSVALWLAGLGAAFAVLRAGADERAAATAPARPRVVAAALSVALGVGAPAVIAWPIVPVARQLGGGLTPYGDLAVWPWVGLATLDAARQPVASLPSAALAGLMLVLGSLAWLFAAYRARGEREQGEG